MSLLSGKSPAMASLPQKLFEIVANARNFSEMMHGAALLYNLILAEQVQNEELVETYREDFASWTDTGPPAAGGAAE
jgi:hypothetical protein